MEEQRAKKRIKVPATTANLGSGFDSIGVAFQLYLVLDIEPSEQLSFTWNGDLAKIVIDDEDNLILEAIKDVCQLTNNPWPLVHISVTSEIPLTRGLGSSASAYVAGLVAANEHFNNPLSDEELFWLAAKKEGHPDNVGPAIFGGVVIASMDWAQEKVIFTNQTFPKDWEFIVAIPSYPLSTAKARQVLPEQVSKADAVFNVSRFGLLVSSLFTGNREGMIMGLEDKLHQPYRSSLISGFADLLALREELNVLGFVISGAGPTVLALVDRQCNTQLVIEQMEKYLTIPGQSVDIKRLHVDNQGYGVETIIYTGVDICD